MKKIFYILVLSILSISVLAQAPQLFNYQAVLRNDAGEPIASEAVTVNIEILQGSPTGGVVFTETHSTETNEFGLINLQIGSEQSLVAVDWIADDHFIKVSVDGTAMGSAQLLSVPYALHAGSAEETDPVFEASPAAGIETADIDNWDEAYAWGDHAEEGYLTEETQDLADVLSLGNDADGNQIINLADPTDAQDAATKAYVDASAPATYEIGDLAHGGIVFYLEPCGTKGLVAATEDQSAGIKWGGGSTPYYATMAIGDGVYAGKMNTSIIISVHSAKDDFDNHAALVCANYTGGDFGDWYLPSREELYLMFLNLHIQDLGGFSNTWYWSSSESAALRAWAITFMNGTNTSTLKGNTYFVRAVRAF